MNKEEILEKSRQENKNMDVYEREVMKSGGNLAAVVAALLATVFFCIQIFLGEGMNYGLYAIVFSLMGTEFTYKAIKIKKKHEILVAIIYVAAVIMFSIAHIWQLVTASTIL